jgi:AcrR family transcriptional regulator
MNRRLTERGKERRRQLMDFATARFAENGYHPTSVADIVKGLGVGKGVFYWYFSSKEELFLEIMRDAQYDLRRAQQAAIEDDDVAVTRIENGIRATMQWSAAHSDILNLFQFASTEERFAPALRRGGEVAAGDVIRIIKEGMAGGEVRDGDPVMMAHAVLGVTAYMARVFIHEQKHDPIDVADECVAFCLEGLLTS